MKLIFRHQAYQTRAVESVVDCFKGQPNTLGINYRIDPDQVEQETTAEFGYERPGFKNAGISIPEQQFLEMETGIGKIYCYDTLLPSQPPASSLLFSLSPQRTQSYTEEG